MSNSNFNFTVKFFRPPQRTVSCHNGLLDTRTKHTVARDRLLVAEQRILDIERRKSASHLQLLAFEQKQLEKRLSSLHNLDQSPQTRYRSTSVANLHNNHQTTSWIDTSDMNQSKPYVNLHNNNQNFLSIPKTDDFQRRFATYSGKDILNNNIESSDEEDNSKSMKKKTIQLPIVAVIPPEEDALFSVQ